MLYFFYSNNINCDIFDTAVLTVVVKLNFTKIKWLNKQTKNNILLEYIMSACI